MALWRENPRLKYQKNTTSSKVLELSPADFLLCTIEKNPALPATFPQTPGWVEQLWVRLGVSRWELWGVLPVDAAVSSGRGPKLTENDNLEDEHETTHRCFGGYGGATGVCGGGPRAGPTGAGRYVAAMYFGGAEFFFGDGGDRRSGAVLLENPAAVRQDAVSAGQHARWSFGSGQRAGTFCRQGLSENHV